MIKEKMDETYGGAGYWNVVVGESFEVMRSKVEEGGGSYNPSD